MLKLENIHVIFEKKTAMEKKILQDVNLQVKEGEFVSIIGDNGAGKSTLFRLISGFIRPDSGKIILNGENLCKISPQKRALWISKVLQDPKAGTLENMSIQENMAFAFLRGRKFQWTRWMQKQRIHCIKKKLEFFNMGLEDRLHDKVFYLSGGQRQALSMAMAMANPSKILLLDEITAALDPRSSEWIMKLAHQQIEKEKRTCLMITHNLSHAIAYGNRLLIMRNGRFVKEYCSEEKSKLQPCDLIAEFSKDPETISLGT